MTQEEKQLLLVDLSARLSYGVILNCCNLVGEKLYTIDSNGLVNNDYDLEEVKPCLSPLSSMTSKQRAELSMLVANEYDMLKSFLIEIDFYHKHHIDYRGLIEKGLAIDCTNLNIY